MLFFKSKKDKAIKKIAPKNLSLLSASERESEYFILKMLDWQSDYDYVDWHVFKDSWFFCKSCNGYSEGSCICYAR